MKKNILFLVLVLLLNITESKSQVNIVLDTSFRQTMHGFGVSSSYTPQRVTNLITDSLRQLTYDLMFTKKGADLSIVRVQINKNGTRDYGADSLGIFAKNDTLQYLINKAAKDRGVEHFYCVPWTAPPEYKQNDTLTRRTSSDPDNYVPVQNYENYARWTVKFIKNYEKYRGIKFRTLGVQNEPDFITTAWATCEWTSATLKNYTKVLKSKLDSAGVDVDVLMPECAGWTNSKSFAQAAMLDPICEDAIDIIASHGYNAGTSADLWSLASAYNKPVWQTEWSDFNPFTTSIADGLTWSSRIADNLNRGNLSAWIYWGILGINDNQGILGTTTARDQVKITKRLWTIAQYSRFIRPGARRIAITGIADPWYLSSFYDSTQSQVALVVHNGTVTTDSFSLDLSRYQLLNDTVQVFRTSATESMDSLTPLIIQGNNFKFTRKAQSVTTYLLKAIPKISTGITSLDKDTDLLIVYPNPASQSFTIKWNQETRNQGQVQVFDLFGREVMKKDIEGQSEITFDSSELSKGIYLIQLQVENKVYRAKVVIK